MNIESKYSASFTAGALLHAETIALLKYLNDDNKAMVSACSNAQAVNDAEYLQLVHYCTQKP